MIDIIFSKITRPEEIGTEGVVPSVGGFAEEEYLARGKSGGNIFGMILQSEDSVESIKRMIDCAIAADSKIIMVDTENGATGKQISHIRDYIKSEYKQYEELSGFYETRIVFMDLT